jgi:hypothetical protein
MKSELRLEFEAQKLVDDRDEYILWLENKLLASNSSLILSTGTKPSTGGVIYRNDGNFNNPLQNIHGNFTGYPIQEISQKQKL